MTIKSGALVQVKLFDGSKVTRRVVQELKTHVLVCNEEEFKAALKEERKPDGIGFPKEDVSLAESNKEGN